MGENSEEKDKDEGGQSGGFRFNAPVTAGKQVFVDGNVGQINLNEGLSTDDLLKLDQLFVPLKEQVQAAPPEKLQAADEKTQELHTELAKGQAAQPDKLNKIVDALIDMVPGALSTVVTMFANPILGALVGPATKLVLDHLQAK